MTKQAILLGLLVLGFVGQAQSRYNTLMGQLNLSEDYTDVKSAFEQLEQITCMVDYYPFMADKALKANHRFEGVAYLDQALRWGYSMPEFQTRYAEAYGKLSQVTRDSLLNHLSITNAINFNWQERQLLNTIFNQDAINQARNECDTNQRLLASALRDLLNQYMLKNGFPNDCKVGYGMRMKGVRLVYNRSYLLFDSEWDQLDAILLTAAQSNQISMRLYASMVDTYLYLKYGTFRYGTARFSSDEKQQAYIKAHIEEINEARREIGLEKIVLD